MAEEIEVPSHFLCPISMQLMKDPVTVSAGITYDRESIERWLYSCKNNTCPVTRQPLSDTELTPNHTLRRLIQAWCTINASHGIQRIPTPNTYVHRTHISKLISDAKKSPFLHQKCLQTLRSIALKGSQSENKCLEAAGAVEFLAPIINQNESSTDEALSILYHIEPSETSLKKLAKNDGQIVVSLVRVLECGNCQSRAYAIMLMKSTLKVADPCQLTRIGPDLFTQVVQVVKDKISEQASKAGLKLLAEVSPWGRNRVKVVQSGAVPVLVEMLLESSERRTCELALVVLDKLCGCAEGRADLLQDGAGLAAVAKKILRVSHLATDRAVRILGSICKYSATSGVLQEMMQVGVVSKLCLVMEVDASVKVKERSKEILKLHSKVWKNSPCLPSNLLSCYPS
ncbi:Ubiquitin--protein ligase [Bertholletia excelsa]